MRRPCHASVNLSATHESVGKKETLSSKHRGVFFAQSLGAPGGE